MPFKCAQAEQAAHRLACCLQKRIHHEQQGLGRDHNAVDVCEGSGNQLAIETLLLAIKLSREEGGPAMLRAEDQD